MTHDEADFEALAEQNTTLAEENSGLLSTLRMQSRRMKKLEDMLKEEREGGADSADVKHVLNYWKRELGKDSRTKISLQGERAQAVRAALKKMKYSVEDLCLAIDGLKVAPFEVYGEYRSSGATRKDDLVDAFKNEKRVESLIQIAREAGAPAVAAMSEQDVEAWARNLQGHDRLLERLSEARGWTLEALRELQVGWDGSRVMFPVRDVSGGLVNVVRYASKQTPKSLALKGRPRDLFPGPERWKDGVLWVCEGEADAVTARVFGVQGCGLPGTAGWKSQWSVRFRDRVVRVCMDCDEPGRRAAERIVADLMPVAGSVAVVDLDPSRVDGWDLTDALVEGRGLSWLEGRVGAAIKRMAA